MTVCTIPGIPSRGGGLDVLRLLDERRRLGDIPAEDVALDEVGKPDLCLVRDVVLCRDGEDLCVATLAFAS